MVAWKAIRARLIIFYQRFNTLIEIVFFFFVSSSWCTNLGLRPIQRVIVVHLWARVQVHGSMALNEVGPVFRAYGQLIISMLNKVMILLVEYIRERRQHAFCCMLYSKGNAQQLGITNFYLVKVSVGIALSHDCGCSSGASMLVAFEMV